MEEDGIGQTRLGMQEIDIRTKEENFCAAFGVVAKGKLHLDDLGKPNTWATYLVIHDR